LLAINVQSNIIGKKSACTLMFGVPHGDVLEVGTNIEIHNKGLLGKGKIERFYLDAGRIVSNFHFLIVPMGTLGVSNSSKGRGKSFSGRQNRTAQCNL